MKRKLFLLLCALLTMIGVQAQETPTNDGIYYIYNSEADLFLTRGNDWGTQAVANPVALPWKVSVSDGKYTLRMYDLTVAGSNTGFGSNGFTDNGSPIQFTPSGNATDGFTLKNGDNYITCPATAGVVTLSTTASAWKFMTQAQYNAVLAARVTAQESAIATAKGIVIPAGKTLNDVVSNPDEWAVDATVNDGVPTSEKWTATKHSGRGGNLNWGGYGSEMYQCGDAHYTRTISGLKKGIYKVAIRGMKRMGNNETCTTMGNAGYPVSDSYLTANGNVIRFKAWYEDRVSDTNPNSTGDFVSIVNNGGYTTEGFAYVGDDGNLVLDASSEAFWGGSWFLFNGISYTFYNNEVSPEDATAIIAQADNLLTEEMDATIKSTLLSARNTFDAARTIANYNALNTAISAAQTSADAYAAFAPERTKAIALGMDPAVVETYVPDVNALKVAEYSYVTTTYPYAVSLGEWTSTGTNTSAATFNNEHWSGETHDYKNQNDTNGQGWNANSWSINFSQNVPLPSGTYVFKVAGRQASGDQVTTSLVVKKGEDVLGSVNDFPRSNNARGINKSGETAFEGDASTFANGGNGFGWEWRYVKFTLDEESTVNIAVNAVATAIHQWVSFGDYTLQADNGDVADILAYNVAKASAITVRDDAQYVNVTGSERTALVNAINADPSSDYPAARTALDNARVAFTGAKTAYDAYVAAKAEEYEDNLPYASSTKFAAIGTAQAAADATSASDAEAKTNAIISAYRKYVESNALAEGVGGIDKTNLISDANFSGVTIEGQTAGAWAFSQTGGTAAILSGESFTDGDGNANYSYFDYNNGGGNNQNLSQTLTALPKGQYLLTVTARATTAMTGNYYLSVDFDETSAKEAIPAIGNTGGIFGRGWNDVSLVFNHVSDGDVTIHVYGENGKKGWSGATRFRLVKMDQVATIGATGWTTFASAYPLDLGGMSASTGDVKAYYASSVGTGKIVMTSTTSEGVAASTGLMLKGTVGATITIPVAISGSPIDGNHLVGCPNGETLTANANYYVLINNGGTAEFQSLKTNGATIPAGKAYLNSADPTSGARLVISFDEEEDPTAISAIEAAEAEDGALKDGKYLIGNKIVLVKNGVKYSANGQKLN